HEFVGVRIACAAFLEIAVGTALLHGANAAHASVALVTAPLEEHDFAGRFFGASEHATHHHGAGACGNGFGYVARVANAAICDQWHAGALKGRGDVVNSGDL